MPTATNTQTCQRCGKNQSGCRRFRCDGCDRLCCRRCTPHSHMFKGRPHFHECHECQAGREEAQQDTCAARATWRANS